MVSASLGCSSREHPGMELRTWIRDEHSGVATRFEQAIVGFVPPDRWPERADGGGASIAWLLFHLSWHQDLAVNTAVRGEAPLLNDHRAALGLDGVDPWAGLGEVEQPDVTALLQLDSLRRYAAEVHASTQAWLDAVDLAELEAVPPTGARIDELAGVPEAAVPWLHGMWRGKPGAFFVQWEATGHPLSHVGEMISVRGRLGLSPF